MWHMYTANQSYYYVLSAHSSVWIDYMYVVYFPLMLSPDQVPCSTRTVHLDSFAETVAKQDCEGIVY